MAFLRRLLPEAVSSKMLAASLCLGVVVGAMVAVFEYITIEVVAHEVVHWPIGLQAIAPLAGLTISWLVLRYLGGGASPATSDEYIVQFHSRNPTYDARAVPARLLGGIATIGSGGALGLEGPSIYLGSASGHFLHRFLERTWGGARPSNS